MICDGPHFLPVKLLGIQTHTVVKIGLINVEIHHARIRSADLCNIGITESSSYLRCTTPLINLLCHICIAAFYHACNNSMSLSGTLQICYHLTNCTTCI